jgi:hypothetical protein
VIPPPELPRAQLSAGTSVLRKEVMPVEILAAIVLLYLVDKLTRQR